MSDEDAIATLEAVRTLNDKIQVWCNAHADDVPAELEKLLALLDVVLNGP